MADPAAFLRTLGALARPGGLVIVDIRAPIAPQVISTTKLNANPIVIDAAIDLDLIFQYSRPIPGDNGKRF